MGEGDGAQARVTTVVVVVIWMQVQNNVLGLALVLARVLFQRIINTHLLGVVRTIWWVPNTAAAAVHHPIGACSRTEVVLRCRGRRVRDRVRTCARGDQVSPSLTPHLWASYGPALGQLWATY